MRAACIKPAGSSALAARVCRVREMYCSEGSASPPSGSPRACGLEGLSRSACANGPMVFMCPVAALTAPPVTQWGSGCWRLTRLNLRVTPGFSLAQGCWAQPDLSARRTAVRPVKRSRFGPSTGFSPAPAVAIPYLRLVTLMRQPSILGHNIWDRNCCGNIPPPQLRQVKPRASSRAVCIE